MRCQSQACGRYGTMEFRAPQTLLKIIVVILMIICTRSRARPMSFRKGDDGDDADLNKNPGAGHEPRALAGGGNRRL